MALCLVVSAQFRLSLSMERSVGHVAAYVYKQLTGLRVRVRVDISRGGIRQTKPRQMKIRLGIRILHRPVAMRFESQHSLNRILHVFQPLHVRKFKSRALCRKVEGLGGKVVAGIPCDLAAILQKDKMGGIDLSSGKTQIGVQAPVWL